MADVGGIDQVKDDDIIITNVEEKDINNVEEKDITRPIVEEKEIITIVEEKDADITNVEEKEETKNDDLKTLVGLMGIPEVEILNFGSDDVDDYADNNLSMIPAYSHSNFDDDELTDCDDDVS